MKILITILCLIFTFPIDCFSAIKPNSSATTYVVLQSAANTLTVHVDRTSNHATQLILRGVSMDIVNQVQNVL